MQTVVKPASPRVRSGALSYISLFTSVSTLLCCALPALFVLLGLGATVASILASAPWLVALSRHKGWVFATAVTLFAANLVFVNLLLPRLRAGGAGCPPDRQEACNRVRRQSNVLL